MFGLVVEEGVDGSIVSRAFEVAFGTLDTALWPFIALQSSQRLESRSRRAEFPLRMGAVSADSLSHRIPRWEEASRGLRRPTRTPHTACPCRKTKPGYMITYKRAGRTLIFLSRHFLHPVDGLPRYTMLD